MKKKVGNKRAEWDARWDAMFAALVKYRRWHGDCRVPPGWSVNPELAKWVRLQRKAHRMNRLRPDRFRRLQRLGVVWDCDTDQWEQRFAELEAFKSRYGHCAVPRDWRENPRLGTWVHNQRVRKRRGETGAERIRRLEAIGFEWSPHRKGEQLRGAYARNEAWEQLFNQLEKFQQRYGHCRVPRKRPGNRRLATWVFKQRQLQRRGQLAPDRFRRLDAIGFAWEATEFAHQGWQKSWARLMEFRRRFGHCQVPPTWREDRALGAWVASQRALWKKGLLTEETVRRLDEVGFVWDAGSKRRERWDGLWSAKCAELAAFHCEHGHWDVPCDRPEFRKLRLWMNHQRLCHRHGRLRADRLRRLEGIHFPWQSCRSRPPRDAGAPSSNARASSQVNNRPSPHAGPNKPTTLV